jgi:hypothetical protein
MSTRPDARISRERLNQIALRKLSSFGIRTQVDPNQTLIGEWTFRSGSVIAPGTQVRIASARFAVEGHDTLVFLTPPLSALGPLVFYDAESIEAFEARVARAISVRLGYLRSLVGQLEARRIPTKLDPNTLVLRGEIDTTEHLFALEADPNGVRMVSVRSRLTQKPPTPIDFPVRLEEHATRADLELFLATAAQRGELTPRVTGRGPADAPELRLLPPSPGALTLGLFARLGPEVTVAVQNGKLEASQELRLGSETFRFVATHVSGATFHGRLVAGTTERWSDRFDLARFPGVEELARICLGVPKAQPLQPRSAEERPREIAKPEAIAGQLPPAPGELWVMNVLVERESDGEVRYSCADLDGRPYGATRLLRSDDFRATFAPHGPGWRLRIEISRLEGDGVFYRQLNPKGERGPEKRLPLATLMTVFAPEAQAY